MHVQTSLWNRRFLTMTFVAAGLLCAMTLGVKAQQSAAAESKDQPYAIEYYYKAKWGHADEFLALFKKNHYPVLKKEMELGRMLKVSMVTPRYHMTEDSRWDYRFQERSHRQRQFRQLDDHQAALSRPGNVQERRAAPLRDSRRALGPAHQGRGPRHSLRNLRCAQKTSVLCALLVSSWL
jgi:hypothetical protein